MFENYFKDQFGITDNITYLPQYAESIFNPEICRKKPNNSIDLLFAGNIGAAQSVETIIKAANELKDNQSLKWHIVGEGSDLEKCRKLADELDVKSVVFYGRKPIEDMPKYYAMADAMLVTMVDDSILSMTLPGKVQTYMAAGKPIIGAINGEANLLINEAGCGYCCEAENYLRLAEQINKFVSKRCYADLGVLAEEYYNDNFTKNVVIDKLLFVLESTCKERRTL
jgi:glycosyltransferase involved in cell wall biosynthesis